MKFTGPSWIRSLLMLLLVTGSLACTTPSYVLELESSSDTFYQLDDQIPEDSAMVALVAVYAADLQSRMNTVIARSETPITRGRPEGTLNNLSADILRSAAVRELGQPVHIGIANFGGLRAPLPGGEITIGNIYELMPFENTISVLLLSGEQVRMLADQIAARRGEPVSGIRFRIEDGRAVDILVGAEPLRRNQEYWVATNSYVADGGDGMDVFMQARERIDLPVLIRDAMIEYIRHRRVLDYQLEGRIRLTDE